MHPEIDPVRGLSVEPALSGLYAYRLAQVSYSTDSSQLKPAMEVWKTFLLLFVALATARARCKCYQYIMQALYRLLDGLTVTRVYFDTSICTFMLHAHELSYSSDLFAKFISH